MTQRDQIAEQALRLEAADRAYIADLLEGSLLEEGFASQEIADAWSWEIDRRIAAHSRGETHAVSAEASLEQLRTAVVQHRAKSVST